MDRFRIVDKPEGDQTRANFTALICGCQVFGCILEGRILRIDRIMSLLEIDTTYFRLYLWNVYAKWNQLK